MATDRAQSFAGRAMDAATALEIAYRRAQRTVDEWFAVNMAADIPNDGTPILEGSQPLTGAQVTNVITRLSEMIADYDANGKAKLNTIIPASRAPSDWR